MRRFIAPLSIFAAASVYYALQACPTFYFWDSAELTAAVLAGGVPHPPGFPFFLMLAKTWAAILPLSPAYALSLFSAFFAALGLVLWYMVILRVVRMIRLGGSEIVPEILSAMAVLVMAVSLTYSIQATRLEVYSLNFCGFAALLIISMHVAERPRPRRIWFITLFLIMGLSFGVHNLTIALAIPGILMILILPRKVQAAHIAAGFAGSLVVAVASYSTILFLARRNPELSWGDPSNLSRLMDYILVKGFSVTSARLTAAHLSDSLAFFAGVLTKQLGYAGFILSIPGIIYLFMRNWRIGVPMGTILIFNSLSVVFAADYFYENYDLHGYLMISLGVTVLTLAVSLGLLFGYFQKGMAKRIIRSHHRWAMAGVLLVAGLAFASPFKRNFLSANLSQVRTAEYYARQFISQAPSDAIIITSSYNTYFCLLAFKATQKGDTGRIILNLYDWDHQWGREQANGRLQCVLPVTARRQSFYRDFVNHFMNRRPLFIEYDESSGPVAQYLHPRGLGYLFSVEASSAGDPASVADDITAHVSQALLSQDLESIRTWVLWFQNRGEYYKRRGDQSSANEYFAAIDSLAARIHIQ